MQTTLIYADLIVIYIFSAFWLAHTSVLNVSMKIILKPQSQGFDE